MMEVRSSETMSPAMASAHAYHDWVFSAISPHLRPGRILEVGSGHGRYSRRIAPITQTLIVSDIDPVAVESMRGELSDLPNVEFLVMPGVEPARLGGSVDSIVLANVLEHIEDDRGTLDSCRQALARDGRLVIFVPAFELLFSRMDEEAGHFRRYSRSDLRRKLEAAGFTVRTLHYFNAVGFFGWFANKLTQSSLQGGGTNLQIRIYDKLIRVAKHLDRFMPIVGQSLVAVATPST